jgi:hypothetical protein
VTLGFLSLDSFMEDDLIDDGALEKIENFMFETKSPDAIARSEDSVTNDQVPPHTPHAHTARTHTHTHTARTARTC